MSLKSTDSLYLGYIQIANCNFGIDILKKHKPNKCHELGMHMDQKPDVKLSDVLTVPDHRLCQSSDVVTCVGAPERSQR